MSTDKEKIRYKKILAAKLLIESGFYDQIEEEIIEGLLGGETSMSEVFLAYFDLYTEEIHDCKAEDRKRASWSFLWLIIAMAVALAILLCGAYHIFSSTTWDHAAAPSVITAIGGGISAFIAKTFLGLHRLSLEQLKHSSEDSRVAQHIFMARMLADHLPDDQARQNIYGEIISHLLSLSRRNASTPNSP